jgi:2-aminoadipate transaminase
MSWTRPAGGFFTWVTFPAGVDAAALAQEALAAGVAFVPGGVFYADGRGGGEARLAFSRATEEEIEDGVGRLVSLLPR